MTLQELVDQLGVLHEAGKALLVPFPPTYPGPLATIIDNGRYNAWPVAVSKPLQDGRVFAGWTDAADHHITQDGKAVGCFGVVAPDKKTVAWGAPFVIYAEPGKFFTLFGLSQISSGRLWASVWTDSGAGGTGGRSYLRRSDDAGATWVGLIDLHAVSGFTAGTWACGPVVELPNGHLLVTVEGFNVGQTNLASWVKVLRSTDGGVTFGNPVTVGDFASTGRPYYESKLLHDSALGRLYCIHRTSGGPGTHYLNWSDDNGQTWTAPIAGPAGFGAPSCALLVGGAIVFATRRNSDSQTILWASTNRTQWTEIVVDTGCFEMEYAAPIELDADHLMVIFGAQPTSAANNCDIRSRILTREPPVLPPPSPPAAPGGWSATDKAAAISVSNGVASVSNSLGMVRGVTARDAATANHYFEVDLTGFNALVGLATSAANLASFPGASAGGWAYYPHSNQKYAAGQVGPYGASGSNRIGVWLKNGVIRIIRDGADLGPMHSITGLVMPAWGAGSSSGAFACTLYVNGPFSHKPADAAAWG
jgi:BNR repeat-like domain